MRKWKDILGWPSQQQQKTFNIKSWAISGCQTVKHDRKRVRLDRDGTGAGVAPRPERHPRDPARGSGRRSGPHQ